MILKTAFTKLFKIREDAARARAEASPGADDGFDPHEKPFLDHLEDLRKTLMQMVFTLLVVTIVSFVFNQQIFEFVKWPLKHSIIDEKSGLTLWDVANFITLSPQELFMLAIKTSFIAGLIVAFPLLVYQAFQFILPGLRQVEKRLIIPGALVGFVLFLVGASFAFYVATPIALKFFYQFEQDRVGAIDPMSDEMAKPISETQLIDMNGDAILPVGAKEEDPESGAEANANPAGETIPENPLAPAIDPAQVEGEVDVAIQNKSSLDEATKEEIRNYMIQLLAFKEGSEIALRYDETRDKIVLFKVKGKMTQYRIGDYINFLTRLVLVFGISFQLPVVVTILVKLELLTAQTMRATRSYAWVIMMVAAAVFTPPDVLTLGLLAGPLIFLYEVCIVIATIIERNRAKRERAEEEARKTRLAKLYERKADDLTEEEKEELHRHEIEQYEKEHAHLLEDHDDDGHDPYHDDHHHDDPYHDEYGHPIDHHDLDHDHDESWHEDHHHEDEDHQPVQDWPDREAEGDPKGSSEATPAALESDHAEPTEVGDVVDASENPDETSEDSGDEDSDSESTSDDSEHQDHDEDYDDEVCEPTGPVVDLNHGDFDEIMSLPGMDEELAQMLIDHRPYGSFDEVEEVPGMTAEKLNEMIERLMLG